MKSALRDGREWRLAPSPDQTLVDGIRASLGCSSPFAVLLAQRGGASWESLIDPGIRSFHSPFVFSHMERAVDRVVRAIDGGERIFIHGDFDVDGLTGAAVLYRGLRPLLPQNTLKVDVGDRTNGHGISRSSVLRAIEEGFGLVITADCGVSNHDEIDALNGVGIDTIVTDHHIPPASLPDALAIIDAHLDGETYPNRNLAGVGVAYKLVCALYERLGRPTPTPLLDLVALGTVADLVPLSSDGESENRAFVREAFSLIGKGGGSSQGLRVLFDKLSVNPKSISTSDIGYLVAPKLNAANRAGDPKVAFLLLITEIPDQAEYLAEILLDYNRDREIAQNDLIAQAEEFIREEKLNPQEDGLALVAGKYWNEGILGLVASNLAERYRVPSIAISRGDRVSRGSCRSVGEFDISACLEAHRDLLLQFGGHRMAAGFSIANEQLPQLEERLFEYIATHRGEVSSHATEDVDARLAVGEVDLRFYTDLMSLGPFGPGNARPRFLLADCTFSELTLVGNRRQHLKGQVTQNGTSLPFIAFRMAKHLDAFERTGPIELVAHAGFDDWRNSVQIQGIDLVAGGAERLQ
jgi:single-stranded-DNA-specific exonuclease